MPTPKIRFGAGAFAGAAVALWLTPALQYSLPYFNAQVAEIDNDFIKHLVPVAEFSFQTRSTTGRSPDKRQRDISSPAPST